MKKKVGLIIFVIILILLILFVAIYTRPRTLLSFIDGRKPTFIFASTSQMNFQYAQPQSDRWQLSDEQQADPASHSSIMELTGDLKYRLSLRSLFHPNSFEGDHRKIDSDIDLYLVFEDGSYINFYHLGTTVGITGLGQEGFILATVLNEEVLAALSDYIIEVGEKQ